MTDQVNWDGLPGATEHRTVGPHRAWCYADSEWCYPVWNDSQAMLCRCCDQTLVPDRWKGLNVGTVLADLRRGVEGLERVLTFPDPDEGSLVCVWLDEVLDLLVGADPDSRGDEVS